MSEQKRILVAEDNNVLANVLRFNLEAAGFAVTVAANGQEAIRQLAEKAFDLLITDYQMPIADGAEVCRAARSDLGLNALPIVLCSAKGLELDTAEFQRRFDISRIFFKPFSMREMLSVAHGATQNDVPESVATGG